MKRGGPEVAQGGLPWPGQPQSLLVTAAIGRDERVEPAFRAWRALVDIEGPLDGGTYRLLPLVYERMRSLNIADPLLGRLKGVYRRAWVETHTLLHATAPAVARLELAGVRTLLLKGAPLSITYYRSHGARPMHDLDVVVPTSQRDLALRVLKDAGWRPGSAVKPQELVDQHALDHRDAGGREIDLHWHCLRETPSAAANAWFWSSARPFDLCGVETRQPSPTAMLLNIVVHGVRSNVEPPVRWIVDAATVIRSSPHDIDWVELVRFAKAQKLCHRLALGLSYLVDEHDIQVPELVTRELTAAGRSLIERVENIVYLGPAETMYRPKLFPLIDYWRYLRDQNVWAFIKGYSAFLQRRWRLNHPAKIPLEALTVLGRRITRRQVRS